MQGLDVGYYIWVFFFSAVGFAYFSYGKKQTNFWFMLSGLPLMLYSYFCHSWWQVLLFGIALAAVPFIARKL